MTWEPRWLILGERHDGSRQCVGWRTDEARALTIGRWSAGKYARVLVVLVRDIEAMRDFLLAGASA